MRIGISRIGKPPRIGMRDAELLISLTSDANLRKTFSMTLPASGYMAAQLELSALLSSGYMSIQEELSALTTDGELLRAVTLKTSANLLRHLVLDALTSDGMLSAQLILDALTSDGYVAARSSTTLPSNANLRKSFTISLTTGGLVSLRYLLPAITSDGHVAARLLLDELTSDGHVAARQLLDALTSDGRIGIRLQNTLATSGEIFRSGFFMLDGYDMSGHLYDPKNSGGGLRSSSQRIPGSRRTVLQDEGQNESGKSFTLAWNRAVDKETFHRSISDGDEDVVLYWGRSDRFFRVRLVALPTTKDIDEPWKRVYLQDVTCGIEDHSLYYYRNEATQPGLSVLPWTSAIITNQGTLESPICFRLQGAYNAAQTTSAYAKLLNSGIEERSLYVAPQLLSVEVAELTLDGALKYYLTHTYADLYANSQAFGRDATSSSAVWNSGGYVSVPAGASYYYRFRGNPLLENICLDATITVVSGSPLIQFSTDGVTWTTAVAATEIVSGVLKRYYITGSEKCTEAYVRFYSPTGASMNVQDVSFSMKRDISGYYDQIPMIPAGASRQLQVTGSGSLRAYIYPDFRSRWQP